MLTGDQIEEANLTDWRKLGQGQHARYVIGYFGTGVHFVTRADRTAAGRMGSRASRARTSRQAVSHDDEVA
jgi:hypothetical protein